MGKKILYLGLGLVIGGVVAKEIINNQYENKISYIRAISEKHFRMFLLMNQWVENKQKGFHLEEYFKRKNIRSVAIYGMSYIGQRLYDELKGSGIEIKYAIDKNMKGIYSEIDIYQSLDDLPQVDAIVVTACYYYGDIEKELRLKTNNAIISLEDVVYKLG